MFSIFVRAQRSELVAKCASLTDFYIVLDSELPLAVINLSLVFWWSFYDILYAKYELYIYMMSKPAV